MLDDRMLYSCGIFATPHTSLEEASAGQARCASATKLELRPDDHLLEIGTGWGGLPIHAASRYGCRVTTTTISREQHARRERVRAAGFDDRVTVLLRDYRDLEDTYDKLVAIEMIEAVGWRNFDRFFEPVSELLRARRAALLQAILIDDRAYDVEKAGAQLHHDVHLPGRRAAVDGGHGALRRGATRTCSGWTCRTSPPTTSLTLRHWRERFLAARPPSRPPATTVASSGCGSCTCATARQASLERRITDVQALFAKPSYRVNMRPLIASSTKAGPRDASLANASRPPGPDDVIAALHRARRPCPPTPRR